MGVDVAICENQGEEIVLLSEWKRVATVDYFFLMAYWFSNVVAKMAGMAQGVPLLEDHLEKMHRYIGGDAEAGIERFQNLYNLSLNSFREMKESGIEFVVGGGEIIEQLPLEAFTSEAQSFLGKLMIEGNLITVQDLENLLPFLKFVSLLMDDIRQMYLKEGRGGVAEDLEAARACFEVALDYLKQAAEQKKCVIFSA